MAQEEMQSEDTLSESIYEEAKNVAVFKPLSLYSKITHAAWGEGVFLRYEGDKLIVLFGSVGYKALTLAEVENQETFLL